VLLQTIFHFASAQIRKVPFLNEDLFSLGDIIDVPLQNPESDLRSGRLEAGNEKKGKTENIKENDRKKKTNFL
jgi:hypothetical protein